MLTIEGNGWSVRHENPFLQTFRMSFVASTENTVFTPEDVGLKDEADLRVFFVKNITMDAESVINTLNRMAERVNA